MLALNLFPAISISYTPLPGLDCNRWSLCRICPKHRSLPRDGLYDTLLTLPTALSSWYIGSEPHGQRSEWTSKSSTTNCISCSAGLLEPVFVTACWPINSTSWNIIDTNGKIEIENTVTPIKEPTVILFEFFQSYCDFGTIRTVIFFWSSFWNFTPLFLVVQKKASKMCLFYWLRR